MSRVKLYTPEMYPVMYKTFFKSREKGIDVDSSGEITARKLEKKFGLKNVSAPGVRAKCYKLKNDGYDPKTNTFIKKEPKPAKPVNTLKTKSEKHKNTEEVKVVGYHKEERSVTSDVISMTVRGVEITMVFK